VARHPELAGSQPEREPDELREVEHRQAEVAPDRLGGERLLEVEVEVAKRARGDQAVGVRVDRVADVRPAWAREACLFIVNSGSGGWIRRSCSRATAFPSRP
jgi:hypothetical protein